MINCDKIHKLPYGGDYNPEQFSEEVWQEDMRMFKLAKIDTVTINVFNWALLQPDETTYCFDKLDKIVELVKKNGLQICLATSTGAHPAWMAKRYPDILRTDFEGRKRKFGGRENSCPNSLTYQKYSVALVKKLAERYKDEDSIVAWHVSNEFGGECYCDNCEKAFRVWLRRKYQTMEALNKAWNTAFWGHTFYEWDEIVVPDLRSEHFAYDKTMFQGISLDYKRFMSDSMLMNYRQEYDAIREIIPDAKITTNLMGVFKGLDYKKWAKYMDFVSWDNYPSTEDSYAKIAMGHDLMRGLKGGMPFALMEQTPSVTNWQPYNALKRPGVMRLWSYQAVAHGADTVMFFQMRRSIGACEKYHGAVIDHVGNEHTRVFREIEALGNELVTLQDETLGAVTDAKIAMVFDWDTWWAVEYSAGPSCELKYCTEFLRYYEALRKMNYDVDIIGVEDDLTKYSLVIAPVLYMIKGNMDERIKAYVKQGGNFLTTFFSGYVDQSDLVTVGGYPGKLSDLLGIWVEESDALKMGDENQFIYHGGEYPAKLLCDLLHTKGGAVVSLYEKDFYAGMPVVTVNKFGKGKAYYMATASNEDFYKEFLHDICKEAGIMPVLETPEGIEATSRENKNGKFIFLLNHSEEDKMVRIPSGGIELISNKELKEEAIMIEPKGVRIIKYGI